jgi:hypothetical protein
VKTLKYKWIDRTGWEAGPWDAEPDKVQWQDKVTGLPCLAVRNETMGHWCGYVGISEGHPCFGKKYDDYALGQLGCHGGVTFSGFCQEDNKEHGVCHVPASGEPERVWWLGFDCCHAFDFAPGLVATIKKVGGKPWPDNRYRDLWYVKRQCADLAKQLKATVQLSMPTAPARIPSRLAIR